MAGEVEGRGKEEPATLLGASPPPLCLRVSHSGMNQLEQGCVPHTGQSPSLQLQSAPSPAALRHRALASAGLVCCSGDTPPAPKPRCGARFPAHLLHRRPALALRITPPSPCSTGCLFPHQEQKWRHPVWAVSLTKAVISQGKGGHRGASRGDSSSLETGNVASRGTSQGWGGGS